MQVLDEFQIFDRIDLLSPNHPGEFDTLDLKLLDLLTESTPEAVYLIIDRDLLEQCHDAPIEGKTTLAVKSWSVEGNVIKVDRNEVDELNRESSTITKPLSSSICLVAAFSHRENGTTLHCNECGTPVEIGCDHNINF